jgi:enoyl-CoA hydratase/carnithine racemase
MGSWPEEAVVQLRDRFRGKDKGLSDGIAHKSFTVGIERESPVLLTVSDCLGYVALNRPSKLNAVDSEMLKLLRQCFATIEATPRIRAVVISGTGPVFCAGADLNYVQNVSTKRFALKRFYRDWHRTLGSIARCSRPTVAAVHGLAFAGGFELTQVCDFVVVGESARLSDQHANFGLFPGGGSTQRLPRLIPHRSAKWLLMSGEDLPLEQAFQFGFVNRIVGDDQVGPEATAMAQRLAEKSAGVNRAIKRSFAREFERACAQPLVRDRRLAIAHTRSAEAREGLARFRSRKQRKT